MSNNELDIPKILEEHNINKSRDTVYLTPPIDVEKEKTVMQFVNGTRISYLSMMYIGKRS